MATFTVTTNTDVVDANDGVTSLREALALANGSAGADKIVFASNLAGSTIELQGELVLSSNVTISGDTNQDGDADITISGGNATELISVNRNVAASLTSLALTGGKSYAFDAASAIYNSGFLTVDYCTIANNTAGPGAADGLLAATIVNGGTLTIRQTAFVGNTATATDGADRVYGFGETGGHAAGAVLNYSGATVALDNTLISGGTATGGNGGDGGSYDNRGYDGGDGGSAALGILNFGTMSGSAENNSLGGVATPGIGGSGGSGSITNGDNGFYGQSSLTNLNLDSGSGAITQVTLGTMGANRFTGGDFNGLGGNDVITGSSYSTISGGTGHDSLTGGLGVTASGGLGDDVLICTFVNDSTFSGGEGQDTINFRLDNLSGQTIDLSAASFGFFDSTFTGFENVVGSQGGETIIGSGGSNTLKGFSGGDIFLGGGGTDVVNGGSGNDRLNGGTGHDRLNGGTGRDVLVLSSQASSSDVITDFLSGTDTLEISATQFGGGLVVGALAAGRFRANATGLAGDLNDRFILNTTNGQLFFDSNGSAAGGSQLIATFSGTSEAPVASDFDIV